MKIAMIGHKRIPSREGGIEIVVEELSVRMAALGHNVTAYNRHTDEPKLTEYKDVKIIEIKTSKKSSLNAIIYAFFATLRAVFCKYDVIHFHAEGPCSMIPLAKLFGKRTVATIHGLDWQRAKWGKFASKYILFGEKQAAIRADELIVLSNNVRDYFREKYGREATVVPNGVNRAKNFPANIITEKYNLHSKDYILFLARITPEKGLDLLIDAFQRINTDKKLVIAGRTEPRNEYIQSVIDKAADNKRIIFTGFVCGDELAELFSNCYLYVLPSYIEGMPISLLEAVSYKARCLVSDIPENTEFTGEYTHTFEKGNANSLKEKLEALINNESDYDSNFKKTSANEPERMIEEILSRFDWNSVVDKTIALYQNKK